MPEDPAIWYSSMPAAPDTGGWVFGLAGDTLLVNSEGVAKVVRVWSRTMRANSEYLLSNSLTH